MNPPSFSSRREFLHRGMAAGLMANASSKIMADEKPKGASPAVKLIDTNCYLDRWPIRHLPLAEDTRKLVAKLKSQNVGEAWVGSLDALLHKDLGEVNTRLAESCARHEMLRPIGAVNPALPRWEDDVTRCAKLGMRGIRLHPNYHNYKLDDARFAAALQLATAHKLMVQIAVVMEDERTQNAMWRVPVVDVAPLPQVLQKTPGARVLLVNWQRSSGGKVITSLFKDTKVLFDIAMLESIMGIEALMMELPAERIVFGSYAPVFYFESAKLKLQESALEGKNLNAIAHENATRFLEA
jgi:hypothetical protein